MKTSLVAWITVIAAVMGISSSASARPFAAVGAGFVAQYEGNEETTKVRVPLSLRGGWSWDIADAYVEYSFYDVSDGTGFVSVQSHHHTLLGWARKTLAPVGGRFFPFVALGVGAHLIRVNTQLAGQSTTSSGAPVLAGALATGASYISEMGFEVGIEGRIEASRAFDPNPTLGAVGFVGYRF